MTHRRLLLVIGGVLQLLILVACESSGPASSVDGADPCALRPVHDVVDRANRITQEASLFDAFNQEVIEAQGRKRKHKNKRSDPYAGGDSSSGDSGDSSGSGDKNKNNKKKDEGKSSSSGVGISTMAKAIMVIMKDRRHVSGGSDKSRGLYPKKLRDRVFEQLDIRNKGGDKDRDTFREAVDRLVGKDLIRINKNGKVKLVISMDSSSRSTRRSDDDDKDDKEDSGQQQDSGSGNTDLLQDSDRDGYSDAEEMLKGSDPNDSSSTPRDPAGDGDGDRDGDGSTGDGGGKDPPTSGGSSGVGEKCRKNAECSSGICGNKGICKESGSGADGADGDGGGNPSQPSDGSNGSSCEIDQDCDTNVCVDSVCSRPKRDGESCDSPYDCLNGVCAKASLSPSEPGSLCCKTGEEERGVCTGQPDGSPCVLMSSSSPDATVTMVLEDVCASSYCNLDIGGLCDTLPGEEKIEEGSGNMDGDQYARPNVPGDGSNGSSKGEDVSPAGSSCDAGCISAATIPVSLFVLVVLGATAYSIKNKRDTEAAAVEGDLASDVEAPVEMADDINDPMGSSDSNDNEVQPLVAASAAVVSTDDDNEDGAASENDDIVYVDQEEGSVGDG